MPTFGEIKTSSPRDVYQTVAPADLDKIDLSHPNVRHSIPQKTIEEMAESIAELTQTSAALCALNPDGSFRLLGGRTRLEGVRFIRDNFEYFQELYGLSEIPRFRIQVRAEVKQANWLAVMLADNMMTPLSVPDQVEAVRLAKASDWEDEKIRKALRVSMQHLTKTLMPLMRARQDVLDALQDRLFTVGGALATLELDDEQVDDAVKAVRAMQKAGLMDEAEDEDSGGGDSEPGDDAEDADLLGSLDDDLGNDTGGNKASKTSKAAKSAGKDAKGGTKGTKSSNSPKKDGRTAPKQVRDLSKKLRQSVAKKKAEKAGTIPAMTAKEIAETLEYLMEDHVNAETGKPHYGCPFAFFILSALERKRDQDGKINSLADVIYQIDELTGGTAMWGDDDEAVNGEGEFEMVDGKVKKAGGKVAAGGPAKKTAAKAAKK